MLSGPLHSRVFTSRTVTADRANKLATRDLTKLRQRRVTGTSKKAIGLMSKTTTLYVHHAFLSISLLSLYNCHMKWPNFKFTLERERKAINSTISVWTQAWAQVFTSTLNSLLLSNRMTWDDCKIVSKDVMSIFQRHFHEHHHCQIVRSLIAEWCVFCKS